MLKIGLEMEKLHNLNSGLGQFCLQFAEKAIELRLFDPVFYVPEALKKHKTFKDQSLIIQNPLHRFTNVKTDVDIWHCMHQDSHYLSSSKAKIIITVHDLNFLHKYKSRIRKKIRLNTLQKKVNAASGIVTISKYTHEQLVQHIDIGNKPCKVIYNGVSEHDGNMRRPSFINETDRFIFSIGVISPRKNFHVIANLLNVDDSVKLVIAGNKNNSYMDDIIQYAQSLGVSDHLIIPGEITEAEKHWLYNHCESFIFPSLAEGMGLPVIEAMRFGKPVFLSTLTSLPEIGGDNCYYFKSFNKEHMKQVYESGMHDYQNDPTRSERLKEWTKKFSWETSIKEYSAFYEQVYNTQASM